MPGLLAPTNPVPSYDAPPVKVTTPPPNDTATQNIVNPQQVVRPDNRADQQDAGAAQSFAARYESNFMTFVLRLRGAPDLASSFLELLQGRGMVVSSGIQSGFAAELSQLMEFLQMDEGQLASFLQNQVQSGSRFTGALFQTLRQAYDGAQSEVLKTDILQFLRKFSDFSSTEHLEGKLVRTVGDMARSLPSRWGEPMAELAGQLENGVAAGDRKGNLDLLRGKVFPLVSDYVGLTHDHGRARGLLSMLALDVARYENGSQEGLLQALRHLSANGALPEDLGKLPDEDLMNLMKAAGFQKAAQSNSFADKLASMAGKALRGEAGVNAQEAFRNILSALLINESVYMPLNHVMLPLEWNGRMLFSELWIDPDAEREGESRSRDGGGQTLRILLKMDIQDLGAFDLLLNERGGEVSLYAACPPEVAGLSEQVSAALSQILERNGLRPGQVSVAPMRRPLTISEAFPKLFEKVSGVNVKI